MTQYPRTWAQPFKRSAWARAVMNHREAQKHARALLRDWAAPKVLMSRLNPFQAWLLDRQVMRSLGWKV